MMVRKNIPHTSLTHTTHFKLAVPSLFAYIYHPLNLSTSSTVFYFSDTPDNKLVRLSWWRIAKWVLFAALVMYFIGSIYVMQTLDALLLIKVCRIHVNSYTLNTPYILLCIVLTKQMIVNLPY